MKAKHFLLALSCCCTVSAYSQSSPLEGSWILEDASIVKITAGDTIPIDASTVKENLRFGLFDKLTFKADSLLLFEEGCGCNGVYQLTGNQVEISFTPLPLMWEYRIEDEDLYFKQRFSYAGSDYPARYDYQVLTTYKKTNQ
jgi:hypothetical protein